MPDWLTIEALQAVLAGALAGAALRVAVHAWRDRRALARRWLPERWRDEALPGRFEIAPVSDEERTRLGEDATWFALLGATFGLLVATNEPLAMFAVWLVPPVVAIIAVHAGRPLRAEVEEIRAHVEEHGAEPTTRHLTQPHWMSLAFTGGLATAYASGLMGRLFENIPGWLLAGLAFVVIGFFTTSVMRQERDFAQSDRWPDR
jgi:hypothetical protein